MESPCIAVDSMSSVIGGGQRVCLCICLEAKTIALIRILRPETVGALAVQASHGETLVLPFNGVPHALVVG